jgi:spermidine/putrescine transport system substrate-binding protein
MSGLDNDGGTHESAAGCSGSRGRRAFLAAAGSATLAGCAGFSVPNGGGGGSGGGSDGVNAAVDDGKPFSGETLRVLVWSGNYATRFKERIVPLYEQRTGATLEVTTGWADVLNRIRDAPEDDPPYDVTITEGSFYLTGRSEDLFLPVRRENVPNLDQVMDYYRDFRPTEYGVPVDGAPTNIIYRDELDFQPSSWSDLLSEAAQETNGIGIDRGFWAFPLHAVAVGMDEAQGAQELYEGKSSAVLDAMSEMNITGWATSGTQIWEMFDAGTIDIAQWYFEQTHFDIDEREGLSHFSPPDSPAFVNHWCIVRGTDHRRLAEHFLNFILDADVQTQWSMNSPTLFTNENMTYAGELAEFLPSNTEEAKQLAFPKWEAVFEKWSTYAEAIKEMESASSSGALGPLGADRGAN